MARVFVLMALLASSVRADDWPQWMGEKRDGAWREEGTLEKFPEGGPKTLWRVPVGRGYSGPTVVGDRVYLMDRAPRPRWWAARSTPAARWAICAAWTPGPATWRGSAT
ncbi:MAG: hypothetical protein K2W96_22935 [Gemmataceae bacterium]|nr:hypothetical protein [Gemmataceae bacterium]